MTIPKRLPLLVFAIALGFAWWRALPLAEPEFLPPPPPISSPLPASFATTDLPTAAASAHAASLAELADGRIACAWFSGSREGAADVSIRLSTWNGVQWAPPRIIVDRPMISAATRAHVRKLGNPVLYSNAQGLHLWVVSVGVGGWAGSAINTLHSADGGDHWSDPARLVTSPFFNVSTLVRNPPLALTDGGIGLPVYHEFLGKHGEWLRLDSQGRLQDKSRMPQEVAALQPAVAVLSAREALALLRDAGPGPGQIRVARTANAGQTWEQEAALELGNPNAAVALLRLASGRLLLAANPAAGRNTLQLWLSDDAGKRWQAAKTIAHDASPSAEFSYPALLQGRDGRIHLAYTWLRTGIRHAVFSEAWLTEKAP